jgi:hypothetical protein
MGVRNGKHTSLVESSDERKARKKHPILSSYFTRF